MKPIRVLLIDDEPPARRKVRRLLAEYPEIEIVGEAESGTMAISAVREGKPDLLFLDIQMPDMDGFAVLAALPEDERPYVIFLTAHDQYALRAFEFHAFDYLLKPISPARFEAVMKRTLEHIELVRRGQMQVNLQELLTQQGEKRSRYLKRLLVNVNERLFFLPVESIDLLEAERNYVRIHSQEDSYLMRGTLEGFLASLDPEEFVQVNRSAVVRLEAIAELQSWFHGEYRIHMRKGQQLVWSRRFVKRAPAQLLPRRS